MNCTPSRTESCLTSCYKTLAMLGMQPLYFLITTAVNDTNFIYYEMHQ